MIQTTRNGWILTGAALVVLAALTAGTRQTSALSSGAVAASLPRTAVSHETAPGMVAVQMHDLQETQLMGVRERIVLHDSDGLLGQMNVSTPGSAIPPAMSMPGMPQTRRTDLDRGLRLGGIDGEASTDASGPSWGWLADEVNAAVPPATLPPESGGFGFDPASGSRLYQDRDNRLGTDQGFGTGGNDAFIFQRRRDEGF
jgi:hypothetical protein